MRLNRVCLALAMFALPSARNAAAQSWESVVSFPESPRLYAVGFQVDGTLFAVGGSPWTNGEDQDPTAHSLAVGGAAWQLLPSLEGLGPYYHQGGGIDGLGRIVLFGGINQKDPEDPEPQPIIYDPTVGVVGELPGRGLAAPQALFAYCTDDLGRIYAIGGGGGATGTNSTFVQRFDSASNQWESLTPLPSATADAAAVYDGQGHILVLGGYSPSGLPRQANVARYDIASSSWSDAAVPDLPVALTGARAALGADGRVYVVGGAAGSTSVGTIQTGAYALDLQENTWSTAPSLSVPRQHFGIAVGADDYIYVFGGSNLTGGTGTVERLYATPCPGVEGLPEISQPWSGDTLALSPTVTGGGPLTYQWYRNDQPLADGPAVGGGTIAGASTQSLLITPVFSADDGEYSLEVTNACGSMRSALSLLEVRVPPDISGSWTVTVLHPDWALQSYIYAVDGTRQGGVAVTDTDEPVLWTGTPESALSLALPTDSPGAAVRDFEGDTAVGSWWWPYACYYGGEWLTCYSRQACYWDLASGTHTNRQVSGYEYSSIACIQADVFGGSASSDDESGNYWTHAMWFPAPNHYGFTLHPADRSSSWITAIDGLHQFGSANTPYPAPAPHAAKWAGTAASYEDLHPTGWPTSGISGAQDGQQVGSTGWYTESHAAIWLGSADSYRDVHPADALYSQLADCAGGVQVGSATYASGTHAIALAGSAASVVDLHDFTPEGFTSSQAEAVCIDDSGRVCVGGSGFNSTTGRWEALLWQSGSPPCEGDLDGDNDVDLSDLGIVLADWNCAAGPGACAGDLDGDGDTDLSDLGVVLAAYGLPCP